MFHINMLDLVNHELEFLVFADSDLGGDLETRRSTTGVFGVLVGKNGTYAPVLDVSKRQSGVGWSTPDAEAVAIVSAFKRAVRLHMLMCCLLRFKVQMWLFTDNSAVEAIIAAGHSDQIAYCKRTQGISLAGAHKAFSHLLKRTPSNVNSSDVYTKPIDDPAEFAKMRRALSIVPAPGAA